jgi:hypothetical protein
MANTNTTTRKPTKRDNFTALLKLSEVKADPKLVEFITHEIDLLDRKNTVDKKPTKTQQENEAIKTTVLSAMESNRLYSISEMLKEFPVCKDMSNQKLSSLVRQMVLDKQVERVEDKRKAFFRKVSA